MSNITTTPRARESNSPQWSFHSTPRQNRVIPLVYTPPPILILPGAARIVPDAPKRVKFSSRRDYVTHSYIQLDQPQKKRKIHPHDTMIIPMHLEPMEITNDMCVIQPIRLPVIKPKELKHPKRFIYSLHGLCDDHNHCDLHGPVYHKRYELGCSKCKLIHQPCTLVNCPCNGLGKLYTVGDSYKIYKHFMPEYDWGSTIHIKRPKAALELIQNDINRHLNGQF